MRAYGERICRLTEEHTASLKPGASAPVSIHDLAQQISLDVIMQAVFGVSEPERMKAVAARLLEAINGISPLIVLFPSMRREFGGVGPFAAFRRRRRALEAELDTLITAARAEGPRDDILSLLVHARDERGESMSDAELYDQLILMVIAGHETTAIAIAWAFYALHRPENAEALTRLRAELAATDPSPEALAKLPYLDAVCQETLRRYPLAPAPSPRKLLRPLKLLDYTLPAGTGVVAAIGVTHFREDLYPEPMRFRPERFLERNGLFGQFCIPVCQDEKL
jgi:cytochrome P450 family 110